MRKYSPKTAAFVGSVSDFSESYDSGCTGIRKKMGITIDSVVGISQAPIFPVLDNANAT
ncbi:MAG: hypothetical protein ACM37W_06180 [Actinomycetota bacterium]